MPSLDSGEDENKAKGNMWALDQALDKPMDEEAGRLRDMHGERETSPLVLLRLAFQSLGVVFGDLGTSPVYVLDSTFSHGVEDPDDVIGALSLIIYSLTVIALFKYILVVLRPNDNGQVLSAVGGIKVVRPQMSNDMVKLVAVIIIVGLFCMQHYGTDKVVWLFAPIVFLWFVIIGSIGALNIWKFDRAALKAFSPLHIYWYLRRGSGNWMSLGGIMLSITGIEALFADLSNFPVLAVQVAFILVVFPSLLLTYIGQAAYILKTKGHVSGAFYHSIPDSLYWPVVVVATIAAIIASQASIGATFSIIKQALAHGCFPRVKVVHTPEKFCDQIYIPGINWVLMILCIAVTAGFKSEVQIGNAYGTAVMIVMLVTTLLMIPVMLLVWRSYWILVVAFTCISLLVETAYTTVLFKIGRGGWVPIGIAAIFLIIMYVWHYGSRKRYESENHSKVSMAWILSLGPSLGLVRVPGVGLVYTELANGVPHVFSHFITSLPAIHSLVVFVCIKYLPVYSVPTDERFLVKRIGPKDLRMFRCIARYGYKDLHRKDDDFEKMLFNSLSDFIHMESMLARYSDSDVCSLTSTDLLIEEGEETSTKSIVELTNSSWMASSSLHSQQRNSATVSTSHGIIATRRRMEDELDFLCQAMDAGVVHIIGNTVVRAKQVSGLVKTIALDYIYALLKKIFRENSVWLNLPHESMLNVGQIFYV